MKHRPIKGRYRIVCEACGRAIMFTGGAWMIIDNGRTVCLGEYEGESQRNALRVKKSAVCSY